MRFIAKDIDQLINILTYIREKEGNQEVKTLLYRHRTGFGDYGYDWVEPEIQFEKAAGFVGIFC